LIKTQKGESTYFFSSSVLTQGGHYTRSATLSCGHPLEILTDDTDKPWIIGRVEHSDAYYFCGDETPYLCSGMKVRIRDI